MNTDKWIHQTINAFYYLVTLILVTVTLFTLIYFISPDHMFSTTHQSNGWLLSYNYLGIDNSITIKYTILSASAQVTSSKWTMIVSWVLLAQTISSLLYYIMKNIRDLSQNCVINKRPFELSHIQTFKNMALYILQLSLFLQLGLNIVLNLLTSSHGFKLESLIYLPGLFVAVVFYLMVAVFKHGHVLQTESDLTL